MKEIKDLITYLKGIEKMSKVLSKEQKADLANIIGVVLTLLVSLKKDSKLGEAIYEWDR